MIDSSSWTPADGLVLEPNALRATRATKRNVAVLAGPGAGKTEMLAQRADFLFRTGSCPYPRRILAISFKVDAADNLRERVLRRCGSSLASRLDSQTFHGFANRLISRYRPVLKGTDELTKNYIVGLEPTQHNYVNFNDLVPLALHILQASPAARNAVRQTYSHVFLDEFQDCTSTQYDLIKTLFSDGSTLVTAVGDTKQMIMGWAGADLGNFTNLSDDFKSVPLTLYQNFRAQPSLRRMQNRMIAAMEPLAAMPLAALAGSGGTIEASCFDDDKEEATYVATTINELINSGVDHREIAVLVPHVPHQFAKSLIDELASRSIPYRNEHEVQDLTVEPVVQLIYDFLRVVADRQQPKSYQRVMDMVGKNASNQNRADTRRSLFQRHIESVRSKLLISETVSQIDLEHIVDEFLDLVGWPAVASLSPDYRMRQHLDELVKKSVDALEAKREVAPKLAVALSHLSEKTAIRILTLHKSKGLEFDHVIMLGIEQESFFGAADVARNVFFVGSSRARNSLMLTTASMRPRTTEELHWWKEVRNPHAEFLSYALE